MIYPLIYIQWIDICDNTVGWTPIVKLDEWIRPDWVVHQIGWVYEETETHLVLINMVSEIMGSVSHMTKIPVKSIIYRNEIKLKKVK